MKNNTLNNRYQIDQMTKDIPMWKTNIISKIGGGVIHLFMYVAMMLLISAACTAQDCNGVSLACNSDINISTNQECRAYICLDVILESNHPGFANTDFNITAEYNNTAIGTTYNSATGCIEISDDYVDKTLSVSVELIPCGLSCWGDFNIEDKVAPGFVDCSGGSLPDVTIDCDDYLELALNTPALAGLCGEDIIPTFEDEVIKDVCEDGIAKQVKRTWLAVDAKGNVGTCTQTVKVEKFNVSDVVFPQDLIVEVEANACDEYKHLVPDSIEVKHPGFGFPTGIKCPNIMHSYDDVIASQCGVQIKILRNWLVVDWCTGATVTDGQVIKVLDLDGPQVICNLDGLVPNFDTLRYGATAADCTADIVLDPLSIVDGSTAPILVEDCSGVILDEVGYIPAIPGTDQPILGDYREIEMSEDSLFRIPERISDIVWVRYCYIDSCGNGGEYNEFDASDPNQVAPADLTNCCFFEITLSDDKAPNAICEGFTKVQLSGGEEVEVKADVFDDGSFDLCGGEVDFKVKRIGTGAKACDRDDDKFREYVHFCCSDLGKEHTVELEVKDEDGNASYCRGIVNVMNMGPIQIGCPQDTVLLDCADDYRDHDLIGFATNNRSCENANQIGFDYFDLSKFNVSCNIGDIYRSILTVDANGDTIKICNQHIELLGTDLTTLLKDGDYRFPEDIMIDVCGIETTHPDHTGYPETDKEFKCIDIGISYKDSNPISSYNNGLCYTILRTWTVVDWCRYDPYYPNSHSIVGTQEIMVKNSGEPVFDCPDTLMVSVDTLECRAHVNLVSVISDACAAGSQISWAIDGDNDGTVNLTGQGADASGIYPVGTHRVTFTAQNECGGPASQCSYIFIIKGDRPPRPICLSSITWTLNDQGIAQVWASDFDQKSEGGCDGSDTLSFSFVSPEDASYPQPALDLDCADIPNGVSNSIILDVYIIDESGNWESCSVILVLQDTNDSCPDLSPRTSLGGQVMTEELEPVENVEVELHNGNDGFMLMDMTAASGNYAFDNVDYYQQYMLEPHNDVDPLNGVSTLDILKIQRHILGIEALDSPYKMIAADVNNDQLINGIDLVELRKLILGIYEDFPQNESWVFVSERFQFSDVNNPWPYDNHIDYQELYASDMEADFYGVKIGDVNNSVEVNLNQQAITSRNSSFYVKGSKSDLQVGELAQFPFVLDENAVIQGLQMTIEFDTDKLDFQGIDGAELQMTDSNFALLNTEKGKITISYTHGNGITLSKDDILFNVYFEVKTSVSSDDVFDVNSSLIDAEIYLENGEVRPIEYIQTDLNSSRYGEVELFQNQPNPFNGQTIVAFSIPVPQNIALKIFNAEGKLLWETSDFFEEGIHDFRVDSDVLPSGGLLIYRLESERSSITRRMIHVK